MEKITFQARGHENIRGTHRSTIEITTEPALTLRGDCIIGVGSTIALNDLPDKVKRLATMSDTVICLTLSVDDIVEVIEGRGGEGLTYTDSTCMVARKSSYKCGRTLMIKADRAAIDLNRDMIQVLQDPSVILECELKFIQ